MIIRTVSHILVAVVLCFISTATVFGSENKHDLLNPEYRVHNEIEIEEKQESTERTTTYSDIMYTYTDKVSVGTIRYISQDSQSGLFDSKYWGQWAFSSEYECLTSCMSMALSYIGVDETPESILDFGSGVTIPQNDWGLSQYCQLDFDMAVENYLTGKGKYSPPIIYLDNYSSSGHHVVVVDKLAENTYQVADPYADSLLTVTKTDNTITYTTIWGKTKTDEVNSAIQYYKSDATTERDCYYDLLNPLEKAQYIQEQIYKKIEEM